MKYEQTFYDKINGYQARVFVDGESKIIDNKESAYCVKPSEDGDFVGLYGTKGKLTKASKQDKDVVHYNTPSQMFMRKHNFNTNFKCVYLDIETHTNTVSTGFPHPRQALEPISLIQLLCNDSNKVYIIGDKEFYYKDEYLKHKACEGYEVEYIHCNSEREMLLAFCDFIEREKPLVIYAWNGECFDFPYIYRRLQRNKISVDKMSVFHKVLTHPVSMEETDPAAHIYYSTLKTNGCFYIDMKVVYQKMVFKKLPSYSLSVVSQQLGFDKLDHSEFKTFEDFYNGIYTKPTNPTPQQQQTLCYKNYGKVSEQELKKMGYGQFVLYGVIDVILMHKLDTTYRLSELCGNLLNEYRTNFSTVLTTLAGWSSILTREYEQDHIMIEPAKAEYVGGHIQGGFVRQPVKGVKKWVVSFDVNSMYPSSIISQNMSPEVFIDDIVDYATKNNLDVEKAKELDELVQTHINKGEVDEERYLYLADEIKEKISGLLSDLDVSFSPTGVYFSNKVEGVIPKLIRKYFNLRKQTKQSIKQKQILLKQLKDSL